MGEAHRHPSYLNLHYKQLLVYCTLSLQVLELETHLGVGEGPEAPFPTQNLSFVVTAGNPENGSLGPLARRDVSAGSSF